MSNTRFHLPFSPISIATFSIGSLVVVYLALLVVVMTYAALTIQFSQSIGSDQAQVGVLESQYLALINQVNNTNYIADGYAAPIAEIFVPARTTTALR